MPGRIKIAFCSLALFLGSVGIAEAQSVAPFSDWQATVSDDIYDLAMRSTGDIYTVGMTKIVKYKYSGPTSSTMPISPPGEVDYTIVSGKPANSAFQDNLIKFLPTLGIDSINNLYVTRRIVSVGVGGVDGWILMKLTTLNGCCIAHIVSASWPKIFDEVNDWGGPNDLVVYSSGGGDYIYVSAEYQVDPFTIDYEVRVVKLDTAGTIITEKFAEINEMSQYPSLTINQSNGDVYVGNDMGTAYKVYKYNSSGVLDASWGTGGAASYNQPVGMDFHYMRDMSLDSSGNIYAVGYETNSIAFPGTGFLLLKIDSNGQPAWWRETMIEAQQGWAAGLTTRRAHSVMIDYNDGDSIIVGGTYNSVLAPVQDFLMKYDSDGNKIWELHNNRNPLVGGVTKIIMDPTQPKGFYASGGQIGGDGGGKHLDHYLMMPRLTIGRHTTCGPGDCTGTGKVEAKKQSDNSVIATCPSPCTSPSTVTVPVDGGIGMNIYIEAIEDADSAFTRWAGGGFSTYCGGSSSRPCSFTMLDANTQVLARFDPFDYSLSNSGNITVEQGQSGSNTITGTLISTYSKDVTLSITNPLPFEASASFTNPCSPTCNSTLTIFTTLNTPVGTYPIMVTGAPLNKTTLFNLIVTSSNQPPVLISVGDDGPVDQGKNLTFTYQWDDENGDQGKVHFCKTDIVTWDSNGGYCNNGYNDEYWASTPKQNPNPDSVEDIKYNNVNADDPEIDNSDDPAILPYYAFACDVAGACSATDIGGGVYIGGWNDSVEVRRWPVAHIDVGLPAAVIIDKINSLQGRAAQYKGSPDAYSGTWEYQWRISLPDDGRACSLSGATCDPVGSSCGVGGVCEQRATIINENTPAPTFTAAQAGTYQLQFRVIDDTRKSSWKPTPPLPARTLPKWKEVRP